MVAVACQASISAWVRARGCRPVLAVQDRKFSAWMNRCSAYLPALDRSGAVAALARMRGSWCQRLNWRSSRSCGWPARPVEAAVHPAFVVGELPVGGRAGRRRLTSRSRR